MDNSNTDAAAQSDHNGLQELKHRQRREGEQLKSKHLHQGGELNRTHRRQERELAEVQDKEYEDLVKIQHREHQDLVKEHSEQFMLLRPPRDLEKQQPSRTRLGPEP